ncbi:hypothetical protein H0E84_10100 [Luteimonas sp. SJ-92]|uniref:protein-glutamate methylesterase n=1 Tax=Luteimonas salinisoli TaxID=2752307 RepID=A0A853JDQ7_9GAMM|nr:chemotaxis protein CheB [Luteimonas salinisoli]NZA26739.1 hypothetical protein [Luteimonas salinisoli]
MVDGATRVALLAREGEARARLEQALREAGAELVAVADPTTTDVAEVVAAAPQAVLVALEPAIEDALEAYEPLLGDPGIAVIFDEAELAAQRAGWDAARWVRHLAAKLNRHDDVLPPGREHDPGDWQPSPGPLPQGGHEVSDRDLASIASEARHVADRVPRDGGLDTEAADAGPPVEADAGEADAESGVEAETGDFGAEPESAPAAAESQAGDANAPGLEIDFDFGPDGSGDADASAADTDADAAAMPALSEGLETEDLETEDLDASALEAIALGGDTLQDVKLEGFDFEGLTLEDISFESAEDDAAAGAEAEPRAFQDAGSAGDVMERGAGEAGGEATPASADETMQFEGFDFDIEIGDAPSASAGGAQEQEQEQEPSGPDLAALEQRIAGLSLADADSYGNGPERGAVVIEGGLGGPDAVRQLLAAIPPGFPRPLLVRLRLDGGRYDRLVRQMERAAQLPVALAEEGATVEPGHVYFLPPDIGVARTRAQLRFVAAEGASAALPASLPPDDSAVLFLSGSDPALVDAAMSQAWGGALVAGQSPEGCYDGAAADIVIARGGRSGMPRQLAEELAERWPPPDRPAGAHLEEPIA